MMLCTHLGILFQASLLPVPYIDLEHVPPTDGDRSCEHHVSARDSAFSIQRICEKLRTISRVEN